MSIVNGNIDDFGCDFSLEVKAHEDKIWTTIPENSTPKICLVMDDGPCNIHNSNKFQ